MKASPARRARILKTRDNAMAILQRHGTLEKEGAFKGALRWQRSPPG